QGADLAHEVDARHVGHVPVDEGDVELVGVELGEGVGSVHGFDELEVRQLRLGQRLHDHLPHDARVIDHEGFQFYVHGADLLCANGSKICPVITGAIRDRTRVDQS